MFTISKGRSASSIALYHREEIGVWLGQGAEALGLHVDGPAQLGDNLEPILAGRHPQTGAWLGQRVRLDRVAAYEGVIGAPKSVSLAALGVFAAGTDALIAHREAVGAVWGEIDRLIGAHGPGGNKAIGLALEHTLSRAGDPHLHTHVLLPNLVERNGRWYAWHAGNGFLHRAKLWIDSVYSHALGLALTRHAIRWTRAEPRRLEIVGCPAAMIAKYSRSRAVTGKSLSERTRILREGREHKTAPEPQIREGNPVHHHPIVGPDADDKTDRLVRDILSAGQETPRREPYQADKHLLLDLLRLDIAVPLAALRRSFHRVMAAAREMTQAVIDLAAGVIEVGHENVPTRGWDVYRTTMRATPPPLPSLPPSAPTRHDPTAR